MSKPRLSHRPKRQGPEKPGEGRTKRPRIDAGPPQLTRSSSSFICRRCKAIDFGQDVGNVRGHWKVKTRLDLSSEHLDHACPVCSFLSSIIPEQSLSSGPLEDQYHLCATSAQVAFFSPQGYNRHSLRKSHPQLHALQLPTYTLVPAHVRTKGSGSIHPSVLEPHIQTTGIFTKVLSGLQNPPDGNLACRCVPSDAVDYKRVREWLDFCSEQHGDSCQSSHTEKPPGFGLIDCSTRSILEHPSSVNYLALSYVWGSHPESASYPSSNGAGRKLLPSTVPQVILDAMQVTLNLGYQYLWVDKYCISENAGSEERAEQIRYMDVIYRDAALTIIAAAGDSGHHGLPGVSRSRFQQPQVRIGNDLYVSSMPDPAWLIQNSYWATRGWTYQEALLSRRRLVFTDRQVYFQCFVMHTSESIDIPLEVLHKRGRRIQWGEWNKPGAFPVEGLGSSESEIWQRIAEYSARHLSYESDILNGIDGVFHAFKLQYPDFSHLWGIPAWGHQGETFRNGLLWSSAVPSKRRSGGFPSWSWTGWLGPASRAGLWTVGFAGVSVDIELSSGATISFYDFFNLYSAAEVPASSLSGFLSISGPTVDMTVMQGSLPQPRDTEPRAWWAQIPVSDQLSIIAPFELTKDMEGPESPHAFSAKGICFWSGYESCILAVENHGDFAERIGCVRLRPPSHSDTFEWRRGVFFCIAEGSTLLEQAEALTRFERKRKNSGLSDDGDFTSWVEDFPEWSRVDGLGQIISFDRIKEKLWMDSEKLARFLGAARPTSTRVAEHPIRIG